MYSVNLKTFTAKSGLHPITYKAVDRHNMMGGRGFRVEQLKFQTFVFRFLALYVHILSAECWEVDPDHNSRPNSVFYSRHIWCMDSSAGTGYRHLDLDVQLLLHPLDPSTTQPQPHHEMCSCMVINNVGLGHTDISLPRAYTCHYKSPTQGFLKATYKSRSLNLLL